MTPAEEFVNRLNSAENGFEPYSLTPEDEIVSEKVFEVLASYAPAIHKRFSLLKEGNYLLIEISDKANDFISKCSLSPSVSDVIEFNKIFEAGILHMPNGVHAIFIQEKKEIVDYVTIMKDSKLYTLLRGPEELFKAFWEPYLTQYWNLTDKEIDKICSHFEDVKDEIQEMCMDNHSSKFKPTQKGFIDWLNNQAYSTINATIEEEVDSHGNVWVNSSIKFNRIPTLTRDDITDRFIEYFKYRHEYVTQRLQRIDISDHQQTTDSSFKNTFNSLYDRSLLKSQFEVLTRNKSKNGLPHLTEQQLEKFIEAAFTKGHIDNKIKMNIAGGEKMRVQKVFYDFYKFCEFNYESSSRVKSKYIKLLTDYFEGWTFKAVSGNFSK